MKCVNKNCLEILPIYFAVQRFKSRVQNKHVKLMVDNTTTVALITYMGTNHSDDCNSAVVKYWKFCFEHGAWLTACHISSESNIITDKEYRGFP